MKNTNLKDFNRTLNIAISYVICAKFKKDAINAFEVVTAAGYQIEKRNGTFRVFNPKTNKCIYISDVSKYDYNLVLISEFTYYTIRVNDAKYVIKYGVGVLSRFDFVGYLETPSRNYIVIKRRRMHDAEMSKTREKWHDLKSAARDISYEVNCIEEIQKKIEKLQKALIWHAGAKARAEMDYTNTRVKYGLKAYK